MIVVTEFAFLYCKVCRRDRKGRVYVYVLQDTHIPRLKDMIRKNP